MSSGVVTPFESDGKAAIIEAVPDKRTSGAAEIQDPKLGYTSKESV